MASSAVAQVGECPGAEGFFAEIGIPVVAGHPHPGTVPVQPEEFARKAAMYSIEIVGPPPTLE